MTPVRFSLALAALALAAVAPNARGQGGVYTWGLNMNGPYPSHPSTFYLFGSGTAVESRTAPGAVPALASGVTALSLSGFNGVAVMNGAAYAWGSNASGSVGDGTTTHRVLPTPVVGLGSGVTAVSAGSGHILAIRNGAAYGWGGNSHGEVGDGTTVDRSTAVPVAGLGSGVTAVSAGGSVSFAIRNGALYSWGANSFGQLGNGTYVGATAPTAVPSLSSGVTAVSAGPHHALAVRNGAAYIWGDYYGSTGLEVVPGLNLTGDPNPKAVPGLGSGVTTVATGGNFSAALKGGTVYTWGEAPYGLHQTPTAVAGLPTNVVDISAGTNTCFALTADHRLFAWGSNVYGHLGTTTPTSWAWTPVEVFAPAGYYFSSLSTNGNTSAGILTPVPEPAGLLALAAGAAALAGLRRRLRAGPDPAHRA